MPNKITKVLHKCHPRSNICHFYNFQVIRVYKLLNIFKKADEKSFTNIQKQVSKWILTVDKTMISWFSVLCKVRKKEKRKMIYFG